ncbi:hypothetical protein [Maricaulis sp.]|uniref:hypothetical protein n=1 Tax=Maricaulis sp. TaxID=1486257 RepID=UPI000C5703FD|nr:hypothetical protein [Maricaulis sp.]MAC87724.1 hypothetical protein [Maricaulis sp.]
MTNNNFAGFRYIGEYDTINLRLHKAHPPLVGTPSVVRQIGFWMPWLDRDLVPRSDGSFDGKVRHEDRRSYWVSHADAFVAGLFRNVYREWQKAASDGQSALAVEPYFPNTGEENAHKTLFAHDVDVAQLTQSGPGEVLDLKALKRDFSRRNERVSFEFYFEGIPITIRAGLQDEYFTLTIVLEMSRRWPPAGEAPLEPKVGSFAHDIMTHMDQLEGLTSKRWAAIEEAMRHNNQDHALPLNEQTLEYLDVANFFYNEVWERLDERFLKPALSTMFRLYDRAGRPQLDQTLCVTRDTLGQVFCDLRNCAFSLGVDETPRQSGIPDPRLPECDKLGTTLPFSEPNVFANAPRKALAAFTTDRIFNDRDSLSVVDTFLPFLEASALDDTQAQNLRERIKDGGFSAERPIHKLEYAATRFLDGRAIHISSLLGDAQEDRQRPLKFLLLFRNRHRWQIGRLIERVNYLGTIRLASLVRMSRFTEVGRKLRNLPLDNLVDLDTTDEQYNSLIEDYRSVFATRTPQLGSLEPGAGLDEPRNGKDEVIVGLDRARYYIRQFHHTIEDLRASSIEGFQPYAQFVRRRIGANWDFVESLAERVERVERYLGIARWEANYTQLKAFSEDNNNQNRKTAQLMIVADVAAGIAGTYALSQMITGSANYIFNELGPAMACLVSTSCAVEWWPLEYYLNRVTTGFGAASIADTILAAGLYALMRLWGFPHAIKLWKNLTRPRKN